MTTLIEQALPQLRPAGSSHSKMLGLFSNAAITPAQVVKKTTQEKPNAMQALIDSLNNASKNLTQPKPSLRVVSNEEEKNTSYGSVSKNGLFSRSTQTTTRAPALRMALDNRALIEEVEEDLKQNNNNALFLTEKLNAAIQKTQEFFSGNDKQYDNNTAHFPIPKPAPSAAQKFKEDLAHQVTWMQNLLKRLSASKQNSPELRR